MKTTIKPSEEASALIIAMLVIFLITAAIGIAMTMTNTTLKMTDSSRDFAALRASAEGALDFGYGVWVKTTNSFYAPPTKTQLTAALGTPPAFGANNVTFSYASTADGPLNVTPIDGYGQPSTATSPPSTLVNLDNYPGWAGTNFSYLASVRLTGTFAGGRTVNYGVKRAINYSAVNLFQATAFFEGDLELFRPATMTIGGLVHTNSKAYVSSSDAGLLTFGGNLSYAANGGYLDTVDPPQSNTWSGWAANSEIPPTYSNGGKDQQVNQVSRMEPLGADATTLINTTDSNPNNDSMRELIEPPKNTGAYPDPTPIAQRRLYNRAGIMIHMTVTTTTVKGKTTTVVTPTITTQNGTATLTNTQRNTITNALTQQTIYDFREGQNVDVTTLDIGAVNSTLSGISNFNGIIYIDQTDNSGNISTINPQGIRLKNGSTLPTIPSVNGLTVASQNPVYIQGDYNTTSQSTRGSAAVFADAVTILSNNWNDSSSSSSLSSRVASSTTVNTAIVAGFLPSGWTNPNTGQQYGYSGGLNNFPRFLENWSNKTFTYTGSMIELFTSQVAIGEWDTGSIYSPPNRVWNFDSNFVSKPPAGSWDTVYIGRGALARF
jgi:hypothetical protein